MNNVITKALFGILVSLLNCNNDSKWHGECLLPASLSLSRRGFLQWPWDATSCTGEEAASSAASTTDICWGQNSIIVPDGEPVSVTESTHRGKIECNHSPINPLTVASHVSKETPANQILTAWVKCVIFHQHTHTRASAMHADSPHWTVEASASKVLRQHPWTFELGPLSKVSGQSFGGKKPKSPQQIGA